MIKLIIIGLAACSFITRVVGHARLMLPPSRVSAWRVGFDTPRHYTDMGTNCGGKSVQWDPKSNNGRCGICGDEFLSTNLQYETPGMYATGVLVANYSSNENIDVRVLVTAAHKGYFVFKLCENNNILRDSNQSCFDRYILKVYPSNETFVPVQQTGEMNFKLQLPNVVCSQCVLQWTYTTGNSWGEVGEHSGMGMGKQETFRSCADISIGYSEEKDEDIIDIDIDEFIDEEEESEIINCKCEGRQSTASWVEEISASTEEEETQYTLPFVNILEDATTVGSTAHVTDNFCLNKSNGNYVHPDSLNNYIQCANGIKYDQVCNTNELWFNPMIGACDWLRTYEGYQQ